MGNGPQLPGDWDASGSGEPPAQLLRRAISHVESLLHRLEAPSDNGGALAVRSAAPAGAEDAEGPDLPDTSRDDAPAARDDLAAAAEPADTDPDESLAGESVAGESLAGESLAGESQYVPLPAVSSAAQAEALRITLHAHEEAHRLSAEANTMRAEAAADGERVLVEARMLSDRLHVESRERATELLSAAKHEAAALIDAAQAEAVRITQLARDEAEAARLQLLREAEQERDEARQAVLAQAERDAEALRLEALEAGRAEADRLVQAEVASAAEESRRTVAESHTRALGVLDAANDSADEVRATMRRVIDRLGESLADFDASVAAAHVLRDTVDELTPAVDTDHAPAVDADAPRRPLGLLFGAPRR